MELITNPVCPFCQRATIVLREKHIDFTTTYIDILQPLPEWFTAISPLGKVPVLRIGDQVLFESAVINEYLDETHPPSMHPKDPILRAQNRAWIEYAGQLNGLFVQMLWAADEPEMQKMRQSLNEKLRYLAGKINPAPFFNGTDFCLIDAAYAPLFLRMQLIEQHSPLQLLTDLPQIQRWAKSLLQRPSVSASLPPDFYALYFDLTRKRGPYFSGKYLR